MAAADPWHVVKHEISTTLGEVERLHAAARDLAGPTARPYLEQLETCLASAELDVTDLEETVRIVEAQRERFPIADAELASRRAFVRATSASIEAARRQLGDLRGAALSAASTAPAHEPGSESRQANRQSVCLEENESESEGLLSGAAKPKAAGKPRAAAAAAQAAAAQAAAAQARRQQANEAAVAHVGQQQQMELEAQEEVLDGLHGAMSRVKGMAGMMNEELAAQNRMIGTLEEQMDSVAGSMGALRGKMKQMAASKDRGKYCAILWLSVLLVLLILLAVET